MKVATRFAIAVLPFVLVTGFSSGIKTTDSEILFYEGNGASQSVKCSVRIPIETRQTYYWRRGGNQNHFECPNDEIRSLTMNNVLAGTTITVADDDQGQNKDDVAIIRVKKDITQNTIVRSFDSSVDDANYSVQANYKNGLDGKVSYISVYNPGTASSTPGKDAHGH